ncbi:unnamed protein product [Linum tenue]|uniref:rRNA N-glycosidase n=1 Tax=Linum tenue TaxID=586396 RepID=A0AAV0JWK4_9ROSI|nr:unnamed protein product [Linum tenue]
MADQHSTSHLHRPLLPTPTVVSTARFDSDVFLRLALILSVGLISLWANHEASKGFQVQIFNDARDSPAGKRFDLFYISNDRATRILLNASTFVEHLVYAPEDHPNQKKPVHRVALRLASTSNLTADETVTNHGGKFVIRLSPSLIQGLTAGSRDSAIASAVLRGMARVWLWDGGEESRAPSWVIEAAMECVSRMAGFGVGGSWEELPAENGGGRRRVCWGETTDARMLAGIMEHSERHSKGFILELAVARVEKGRRRRRHNWNAQEEIDSLCFHFISSSPSFWFTLQNSRNGNAETEIQIDCKCKATCCGVIRLGWFHPTVSK